MTYSTYGSVDVQIIDPDSSYYGSYGDLRGQNATGTWRVLLDCGYRTFDGALLRGFQVNADGDMVAVSLPRKP